MILFNVVFVVVVVGLFAGVCFQGGGGRSTKFGIFSDVVGGRICASLDVHCKFLL